MVSKTIDGSSNLSSPAQRIKQQLGSFFVYRRGAIDKLRFKVCFSLAFRISRGSQFVDPLLFASVAAAIAASKAESPTAALKIHQMILIISNIFVFLQRYYSSLNREL